MEISSPAALSRVWNRFYDADDDEDDVEPIKGD